MLLPPKRNHIVDLKDKIKNYYYYYYLRHKYYHFIIIEGINFKNTIICIINITISILVQIINIKNIIFNDSNNIFLL
jgi:hypothetical protein